MKNNKNQKKRKELPDPELLMHINSDSRFFKTLRSVLKMVLIIGLFLFCSHLLQ